jgi:hypothetical protein
LGFEGITKRSIYFQYALLQINRTHAVKTIAVFHVFTLTGSKEERRVKIYTTAKE